MSSLATPQGRRQGLDPADWPGILLFGITSNILALSSQSPSGPAGGAPRADGYELGCWTGLRYNTDRSGLLRVATQVVTIHMSAHALFRHRNRIGSGLTENMNRCGMDRNGHIN